MSTFIRFEPEQMDQVSQTVKGTKNKLLNVNSSTLEVKKMIREKRELINQGIVYINEAHEELNKLVSLMPRVDSAPIRNIKGNFLMMSPGEHHTELMKLSDKISKLK